MRHLRGIVVFAVLCLVLRPAPALALIDWLDPLSGPAGLWGLQFDGRVVCFGERLPRNFFEQLNAANSAAVSSTAVASLAQAQAEAAPQSVKNRDANRVDAQTWLQAINDWNSAALAWEDAENEWARVGVALHVLPADDVQLRRAVGSKAMDSAQTRLKALRPDTATRQDFLRVIESFRDVVEARQTTKRAVQSSFMSTSAVGAFWAACSATQMRRISIDVGASFFWTDDNPGLAGGKRIKLSMLMPSASFRVIPSPRWDVVDVGIGGGMYFFSSEGFPSFTGVVLQPWRVDLHAPSSWAGKPLSSWKRWISFVGFRTGHLLFPDGFPPNAFNPTKPDGSRIAGDLVLERGVFFNFEPFIRRALP